METKKTSHKPKWALQSILSVLGLALLPSPLANAAGAWWDNNGGTANDWGSINNWSTTVGGGTSPLSIPGNATTDLATFSITSLLGTVQTVNLNGARSLGELSFNNTAAITLLAGGSNRILTLAGITGVGITKAGSGAVTIGSATAGSQVAIALSADQSFVNDNNTGAITVMNGVASSTAVARALTLDGTSTAANTISGVISDNGAGVMSLTKNGAGTWVLSGDNTYTGGTSVTAGTLTLSGSGTFGTGLVDISGGTIDLGGKTITNYMGTLYGGTVTNGTIDLTGSNWFVRNGTVSANLSGTGGVVKELAGNTTVLSGNNTHTGETWVSYGTLQLDNVNAVKNSTVRFEGGGFLTFGLTGSNTYNLGNLKGSSALVTIDMGGNTLSIGGNNGTYSYAGMLSGTGGSVTKVGAGTWSLTNTGSSYSGFLSVMDGTLAIDSINNASTNGVLGNSTNSVSMGNTGGVTGTLAYTGSTASSNKKFTMASGGTGAFEVTTAGTTLSLSGQINGSGNLVKSGAGTVILTGSNSYNGSTTVANGKLLVNNSTGNGISTGAVTVNSGATLGGTGTIAGTVNVSGVLSPGASIESLATGALTMATGSEYHYEVNSSVALASGADLQKVNGSLTLSDTIVLTMTDLAVSPVSFKMGDTLTLISYNGVKNGTGLFKNGISGSILNNGDTFTTTGSSQWWQIFYDATAGGSNFTSDQTGSDHFINITAVPEPQAALLGGLGLLTLLRRRRR